MCLCGVVHFSGHVRANTILTPYTPSASPQLSLFPIVTILGLILGAQSFSSPLSTYHLLNFVSVRELVTVPELCPSKSRPPR